MFNAINELEPIITKAVAAFCFILLFIVMYQNAKESKKGGDKISFKFSCAFMVIAGLSLLCIPFC